MPSASLQVSIRGFGGQFLWAGRSDSAKSQSRICDGFLHSRSDRGLVPRQRDDVFQIRVPVMGSCGRVYWPQHARPVDASFKERMQRANMQRANVATGLRWSERSMGAGNVPPCQYNVPLSSDETSYGLTMVPSALSTQHCMHNLAGCSGHCESELVLVLHI